jgi:hypothetical protein
VRRRLAILALLAGVAAIVWHIVGGFVSKPHERPATHVRALDNEAAFKTWLNEQPSRVKEFDALTAFLKREGVGDVVPIWTLAHGDANRLTKCKGAGFILPPRRQWPNIVPALTIVRTHVMPSIGQVEVVSVYRSRGLNLCAGGAQQSRHLTFAALDLIALQRSDNKSLFKTLCAAWQRAGSQSGWGFGAYFYPDRPTANAKARFHVDGTGWRSWGFSKGALSSGCRLIAER